MKNYIQILFVVISLIMSSNAAAFSNPPNSAILKSGQKISKIHQTINSAYLRISLNDNLYGFIDSKMCSFCKTIRIMITPNTAAYANNVKVPLQQAKNRMGRYATIIYDTQTKNISAIRW